MPAQPIVPGPMGALDKLGEGLEASLVVWLSIVLTRTAPFVVLSILGRGFHPAARLAVPATYLAIVASSGLGETVAHLALGLGYYAAVALVFHWVALVDQALSVLDRALLFVMSFAAFLFVPAFVAPPAVSIAFLFVGWELSLKAYGYAIDGRARCSSPRECLFFFLVDPTLVFANRAVPSIESYDARSSLRRFAVGSIAVAIGTLATAPVSAYTRVLVDRMTVATLLPVVALCGAARLLTEYAVHSGVASMQVGMMRMLGYRIGERYRYPLMATSPREFWSRWNVYVVDWVKRYLHVPLSMTLIRRRVASVHGVATAVTAFVGFTLVGGYHDVYTWLISREPTLYATTFFAINASIVIAWAFMQRVVGAPAPRTIQRAAFATVFAVVIGFWT